MYVLHVQYQWSYSNIVIVFTILYSKNILIVDILNPRWQTVRTMHKMLQANMSKTSIQRLVKDNISLHRKLMNMPVFCKTKLRVKCSLLTLNKKHLKELCMFLAFYIGVDRKYIITIGYLNLKAILA